MIPLFPVEQLNFLLGLGTVAMQVATVLLILVLIFRKKSEAIAEISGLVEKWGILLAFLLMLASTVLSLYYSEILGFVPCGLCWLQRIFIYSQAVLFGMALWKKDRHIADYGIALSLVGGAIALYQHYLQMGGTSNIPCPAVPGATDCAARILFEFGYITYPLMALSSLVFVIVLMLFVRKGKSVFIN